MGESPTMLLEHALKVHKTLQRFWQCASSFNTCFCSMAWSRQVHLHLIRQAFARLCYHTKLHACTWVAAILLVSNCFKGGRNTLHAKRWHALLVGLPLAVIS